MIVPVVTINEKSPYEVKVVGQNDFLFYTCHGIKYNVGFAFDNMVYAKGCYQFYIINVNNAKFIRDPLVSETIEAIMETFFDQEPSILLYICDMIDGRQALRNRLFRSWYSKSKNKDRYTFVNRSMDYENVTYYGSILLRKDHPSHDEVIMQFNDYIDSLPAKLDEI